MKNRFYVSFGLSLAVFALSMTFALSLNGYAQKSGDISSGNRTMNPYSLKCEAFHGGDVQSTVKLTNTGKAIPANTTIKVKTPGGTESVAYNDIFKPNTTREAHGAAGNSGPCSAWVAAK